MGNRVVSMTLGGAIGSIVGLVFGAAIAYVVSINALSGTSDAALAFLRHEPMSAIAAFGFAIGMAGGLLAGWSWRDPSLGERAAG